MDPNLAHKFSPEDLVLAYNFARECSEYFADKGERKKAMHAMTRAMDADILKAGILTLTPSRKITSDGLVDSKLRGVSAFRPVRGIHMILNEINDDDRDPIAQAEDYYAAIYSSDEASRCHACEQVIKLTSSPLIMQARILRDVSPCPCILIGTAGPNMMVSGAVFADGVISQPLTDYVSLIPCQGGSDKSPEEATSYRIALLFRAVRIALEELDDYYSQLVVPAPPRTSSGPTPASYADSSGAVSAAHTPPFIGPHFTKFSMQDGTEVELEYTGRMSGAHPLDHAMFTALADTGSGTKTRVVVKFTYRYSREGHELLAHADPTLAPKLWFCDRVKSVGTYVVVMDFVDECDRPLSDADCASLRRAVDVLHEHNFVFGDLRAPNVLTTPDGRVLLVDFDWCGKVGEARYPSEVWMAGETPWAEGMGSEGLIKKEHDVLLLNQLIAPEGHEL